MLNQSVIIVILSYHCNIIISSSYHHSIQSYHHLISLYRRVLLLHLSATSHPRTLRCIPLIFTLVPHIWRWPGPGGHLLSFVLYQVLICCTRYTVRQRRLSASFCELFLTIFTMTNCIRCTVRRRRPSTSSQRTRGTASPCTSLGSSQPSSYHFINISDQS